MIKNMPTATDHAALTILAIRAPLIGLKNVSELKYEVFRQVTFNMINSMITSIRVDYE